MIEAGMSLPLVARPMMETEKALVLKRWKLDLLHGRAMWKRGMTPQELWTVLDTILEKVTLPSCAVFMAVHEAEQSTPIAWVVTRSGNILHAGARESLLRDPEVAAAVQRFLEKETGAVPVTYSPILELRRIT
jgi:hypothetical protein